ncbi:phage tail sheath family protein [Hymenobacter sp. HD11105]
MPIQPTYPGVYIEEIPSGVRTITGVATSITAFIGRALRGPVNSPVIINNFSDYERQFGGLWVDSMVSYAVRDFYQNGGSRAVMVRLTNDATTATIQLPTSAEVPLVLRAVSEGSWGNKLKASVNYKTRDEENENLFNLLITEEGGVTENFLNVSAEANDARYLPRVLEQMSALVRVGGIMPAARPNSTGSTPVAASSVTAPDGMDLTEEQYVGQGTDRSGIHALEATEFNLLCIPPAMRDADTSPSVYSAALSLCLQKRAMLIVDPPFAWGMSADSALRLAEQTLSDLGLAGSAARNAALYFPRIRQADPNRDNQIETFVPCGLIAGIMARTDASRGVWKSPAGLDASLNGVQGLQVKLTDAENGVLNPLGINCLREFAVTGRVVWGARTLRGADQLADTDNKYVAVRRTALFIEESLWRGTKWVVFEPNDEPLWAQIRLNVGAFMHNLFRQGAFQGRTPREAYLVKCDRETTTQTDINQGVVNVLVGFAPLKPAEFVFIKIQQLSGQSDT